MFLREPFSISSSFHFFLFPFFHVFVSSDVFMVGCIFSLHCFFTFFQYFVFVLLPRVLRIWECIFYSQAFFTLHSLLLLWRLPWDCHFYLEGCRASHWGSKHRHGPSVCLNHTVLGNYMISSELHLNLSKFIDKLLVGNSVINFKHFS